VKKLSMKCSMRVLREKVSESSIIMMPYIFKKILFHIKLMENNVFHLHGNIEPF
jgi:hypothetical protein